MPTSAPTGSITNGRSTASSPKKSLMITLRLPSERLRLFPGTVPEIKESSPSTPRKEKEHFSPASSSADVPVQPPSSADNFSETASVSAQGTGPGTPQRNGDGVKTGSKRSSDVMPKPRSKPGPKKRSKLYDFFFFFFPAYYYYFIPLLNVHD